MHECLSTYDNASDFMDKLIDMISEARLNNDMGMFARAVMILLHEAPVVIDKFIMKEHMVLFNVDKLILDNKLIPAIKEYRRITGFGLAKSRDYCMERKSQLEKAGVLKG